jgi:predicted nuclease with RNAse H fold
MRTFELKAKTIIDIDLSGKPQNPTELAVWKNKMIKTTLLYVDDQILETIIQNKPNIIAIDAPFSLPKKGLLREADKEMIRGGYRVFPPSLPAMKKLTIRAMALNRLISEKEFRTIEVHPTSTCKAIGMPKKDWGEIQTILMKMELKGDLKVCTLKSHEIDAVLAALKIRLRL